MLIWVIGGGVVSLSILLFCNLCMWVSVYNRLTKVEETTNHTDALVYEMRQDQLGHAGVYSSRIGDN